MAQVACACATSSFFLFLFVIIIYIVIVIIIIIIMIFINHFFPVHSSKMINSLVTTYGYKHTVVYFMEQPSVAISQESIEGFGLLDYGLCRVG